MKEIVRVLKGIEKENRKGTLKLESLHNVFSDLEKRFRYEFEYFNLTSVAFSYTLPLLTESLQEWDPRKNPAGWLYQMSSWKAMLNSCVWEDYVVPLIVPKLGKMFQELEVKPGNLNLGKQRVRFLWIMSWATVVPSHHMVTMLETGFFPKLQDALYHWLCANPNLDEVVQWYLGWKGSLTTELLAHYRVRDELNVCLEMMHQAAEDIEVVPPKNLREYRQRQFEAQQKAAAFYARLQEEAEADKRRRVTSSGDFNMMPEMSLNEIIEVYAQQNQLSFKPKLGRTHYGHQIYGFGNISVCIDSANQNIFAQTKDSWSLVSLEGLLKMHRNSVTK
ncbi:hypothetical protein MKW94_008000 [Papaver nudicaule]|uniref:GCF C-terminal domain-containing protein n=1 Tax=Papaver nudicaule TaxID=74823 RepID=A0AA41V886_PAPNU|nr:hypothetical protein [Papaver nudicaule]